MLLPLLAILQLAATPPAPVPAEDITVIAERMRRLKLATRTDRKTGAQSCVIKRRSDDDAFDAEMCRATLICAKTVKTGAEMQACLGPTVQAYAERVTQKRDVLRRR